MSACCLQRWVSLLQAGLAFPKLRDGDFVIAERGESNSVVDLSSSRSRYIFARHRQKLTQYMFAFPGDFVGAL